MDIWPSSRVSRGGLFHPHKVTYSKETHDLIKLLMEEQKLSILMRNKVEYCLRSGTSLPETLYTPQKPSMRKSRSASCQIRSRTAHRRTLEEIQASGAFERGKFVPIPFPTEPIEKQKQRLQEHMSGLKHTNESDISFSKIRTKHLNSKKIDVQEIDVIDELLKEIAERADWIKDMEELGEGKHYREMIRNEIAERLTAIKKIEKMRKGVDAKRTTVNQIN